MPPLDCVVFARRQSPDWDALTRDYEAGLAIDPSRYMPPAEIPGFPQDIADCIRVWNSSLWINFFRCRYVLKNISERGVRRITNSIFMPIERLAELPSLIGRKRCLLFFFDDDDWFAPDTFERVSELQLDQGDLAVFPLVRFGVEILTFIRRDNPAHLTLGARRDFGYRFHTNNYGISSALILSEHLQHLKDHILGSRYADRIGLPDKYFDMIISATNKTPCAASSIGRLPIDPAAYRAGIRRYVDNLRRLSLPPELGWMAEPLDETISLFSTV